MTDQSFRNPQDRESVRHPLKAYNLTLKPERPKIWDRVSRSQLTSRNQPEPRTANGIELVKVWRITKQAEDLIGRPIDPPVKSQPKRIAKCDPFLLSAKCPYFAF